MSKAGRFEISVSRGGYPVFLRLIVDGEVVATLAHQESSDLLYAVQKAVHEAKLALPERYRDEVML